MEKRNSKSACLPLVMAALSSGLAGVVCAEGTLASRIQYPVPVIKINAACEGTWANGTPTGGLFVVFLPGTDGAGNYDPSRWRIAVVFTPPETGVRQIVEDWEHLSVDPGDPWYLPATLQSSAYIRWDPLTLPAVPSSLDGTLGLTNEQILALTDPSSNPSYYQMALTGGTGTGTWPCTSGETPEGPSVQVNPPAVDEYGNPIGDAPVSFTFDDVTGSGETSVQVTNSGEPTPLTFKLGTPPTYFNLETTAVFSGNIEICIDFSGISFTSETNIRLLHFTPAGWQDVTTSVDLDSQTICGVTMSLSGFVVAESTSPQEMIAGLVFKVMSMNLKMGISNALDAKLEAVMSALTDAAQHNDGAAINMLNAFINSVDAQRGKALTESEADELCASAEEIIQALSAP